MQQWIKHLIVRQAVTVLLVLTQFRRGRLGDDIFGHDRAVGAETERGLVPVAPFAQAEHGQLVGVLEHRITARHVAIDGRITDAHLALVAGGKQHVTELVRQRHQGHTADARLDILLGDVDVAVGKTVLQHRVETLDRRIDRDGVEPGAEHLGTAFRIVEAFLASEARGHHHAPDPVGAERIDRDGRRQCAVDPARQAQHDAGEAVAVHIIAQADDHRIVDIRRMLVPFFHRAGRAGPAIVAFLPDRVTDLFFPVGEPVHRRAITVEDKGTAIKHDLVLPADPVQEDQRNTRFGDTLCRDLSQPLVVLLDLVGAAVDCDEQVRALLLQVLANLGKPDILADRQADPAALIFDWIGHRAAGEQAFLVKRAVIGEFDLVSDLSDMAAIEQGYAVEELAILTEYRTYQHRRSRPCRRRGQPVEFGLCPFPDCRLEHQVFGRVADQLQFGEDDQVAVRLCAMRRDHRIGIAAQVTDRLGQLRHGDGKLVRHRALIVGAGGDGKSIHPMNPPKARLPRMRPGRKANRPAMTRPI